MNMIDLLFSLASGNIRTKHLTDDRPRTDDGDLHDEIVKILRFRTRQKLYLRAALDLEHPDRVGVLQRLVNEWIIVRNFSKLDLFTAMLANERDRVAYCCHHAQTEQVHFYDAELFAIVFIPLNDRAALHCRGLERDDTIETLP